MVTFFSNARSYAYLYEAHAADLGLEIDADTRNILVAVRLLTTSEEEVAYAALEHALDAERDQLETLFVRARELTADLTAFGAAKTEIERWRTRRCGCWFSANAEMSGTVAVGTRYPKNKE